MSFSRLATNEIELESKGYGRLETGLFVNKFVCVSGRSGWVSFGEILLRMYKEAGHCCCCTIPVQSSLQ